MPSTQDVMFIFPGQGSQYPGIGSDIHRDFASARTIYQRASEVLGYDIAELSFNGSDEKITLTRYTQPVLLTHAIACLEVFKELCGTTPTPIMTAGHSLGEYSALVAAGALSFESALQLVQKRGEFMGEYGAGEMLAIPLDLEAVQPLAEKHYCAVAGCNLRDQTAIGGLPEDLDTLNEELAERFPRKRAVRLKTEGAFHTYYMVEAAKHYRSVLEDIEFQPSEIQVLSNYSGSYHAGNSAAIKTGLFFQLFNPVRWIDNLHAAMADGIETIVEFGGGIGTGETPAEKRPNLEGIVKRAQRGTDYSVNYHAAINLETIRAAAEKF